MVANYSIENVSTGEPSPSGAPEACTSAGKIIVIDQLMGRGKTSWAFQHMRENPEQHYMFVTPLLSEIKRAIEMCPEVYFAEPSHRHGRRKLDDLNDLLFEGRSIATTHVTFTNATAETVQLIKDGHYSLVLDEVCDPIVPFNDATGDRITREDIRVLLDKKLIEVDQRGQVHWTADSYLGSAYSTVERCAKNDCLFLINNSLFLWVFPPEVFRAFEQVFVLTYLFRGSVLRPYLEYYGFEYELAGIEQLPSGRYVLCKPKSDVAIRSKFKELIKLYDNPKANLYGGYSLSATDFDRMPTKNPQKLAALRNELGNYFRNVHHANVSEIMWACPKKARASLKGKGYSGRSLTAEEQALPREQRDALTCQKECFVPLNARAVNTFRNKRVLAYVYNCYANPLLKDFFKAKNKADGTTIEIDEDAYALGTLLQWTWRSQIRDGEPISLWLPSARMRNLLLDWLNGKEIGGQTKNAIADSAIRAA